MRNMLSWHLATCHRIGSRSKVSSSFFSSSYVSDQFGISFILIWWNPWDHFVEHIVYASVQCWQVIHCTHQSTQNKWCLIMYTHYSAIFIQFLSWNYPGRCLMALTLFFSHFTHCKTLWCEGSINWYLAGNTFVPSDIKESSMRIGPYLNS